MVAVKGTTLKADFTNICDRVIDGEVVPEREYAELERIKRNAEYLAKIDRAIAQREAGTMQEHEIIEV